MHLSLIMYQVCPGLQSTSSILTRIRGDLFGANITSFIRYLEDALTLFEDRITRIGTDFTRHWYISAALSLLRSLVDPSDATRQEQQAIEHVARQYYRIRASQEDMHSAKEKVCLSSSL